MCGVCVGCGCLYIGWVFMFYVMGVLCVKDSCVAFL